MRFKFKGFILGVCLGSMIAGSAAYASSSSIEVVSKNLKLWINGIEAKMSQGSQFMYNDTVYVPLRLISEALGGTVTWDEANQSISIDGPKYDKTVAAVYEGGFISKSEHAQYTQVMLFLNPGYNSRVSDPAFIEDLLRDQIAAKVLAQRGHSAAIADQKDNALREIANLKQSYIQNYGYSEDTWNQNLSDLAITEADLTDFIQTQLEASEYLKTTVLESDLQNEYDLNMASHNFDSATFHEIFISFDPNNESARTQEEALQRANEVIAKINKGEDFATLAQTYSDDASSDNDGQYVEMPLNMWPAEFKKAVVDLPLNQLSEPIQSANGYYIIRVEAKKSKTFDEVKEDMRNYYVQQAYQDFTTAELPGLVISLNLK